MLKWFQSIDWLAITTGALLLVCALDTESWLFPQKESQYCKTHDCSDNNSSDYAWWQYSGAWTALFTLVLTVSTIGLWTSTRTSIEDARKSSERELRAYITMRDARIADIEVGKKPIFSVRIENAGKTPAYDFTAHFTPAFLPEYADESFFPSRFKAARQSKGTLAQGQPVDSGTVFIDALLDDQFQALKNGIGAIYILGAIDFIDAFKKPRFKNIRLRYSQRGFLMASDKLDVCELGNDED